MIKTVFSNSMPIKTAISNVTLKKILQQLILDTNEYIYNINNTKDPCIIRMNMRKIFIRITSSKLTIHEKILFATILNLIKDYIYKNNGISSIMVYTRVMPIK
jgi:hypothetical protein